MNRTSRKLAASTYKSREFPVTAKQGAVLMIDIEAFHTFSRGVSAEYLGAVIRQALIDYAAGDRRGVTQLPFIDLVPLSTPETRQ